MSHLATPLVFPLGGSGALEYTPQVEHVALGQSRLLEQFRHKPIINAIVESIMGHVNVLEQVLYDMLSKRLIDGEGAQLDVLGYILGAEREGRSDAAYRTLIRAWAMAHRSSGTPEDLYTTLHRLDPAAALEYEDLPLDPAGFRMRWTAPAMPPAPASADDPTSELVSRLLRRSRAAGVRCWFFWFPRVSSQLFTLGGLPLVFDANRGLGNTARTTGGRLAGEVIA